MAAVGLAPFDGTSKPLIKVWTSTSGKPIASGSVMTQSGLTMSGPKPKKLFTGDEFLQQGTKRFERTIKDAEYQEALRKQFPESTAQILSKSQLQEANKSIIAELPPNNPISSMMSTINSYQIPGTNYWCTFSEWENWVKHYLKANNINITPEQYVEQYWGIPKETWRKISQTKPEIRLNDDVVKALIDQNVINQEELRKLMFHKQVHAGGQASDNVNTFITQFNQKFPVKTKDGVNQYYSDPSELRARAMSLRRLHQTTNKPYKQLLEEFETNPSLYRTDPNINDLIEYYDRESLLNYLNNFLKEGGTLNYLDFFKK